MIPIYRAKKIDSDEYVIFNSFYEYENKYYAINKIINQTIDGWFTNVMIPLTYKIDPTTLAIHFPNMLDSQGNKIFASLSKDGKGGDMTNKGICLYEPKYNQFRIIVNLETRTWLEITREDLESYPVKVIGIQQ